MTSPAYLTRPVPELFRVGQIATQITTGVELHRVIVEVGERHIGYTTPAAPQWGTQYLGEHALSDGPVTELLPPNVGLLHRRQPPRTNRAVVRALGHILLAQKLHTISIGCTDKLDNTLSGVTVSVPVADDPELVFDLIMAYLPYQPMEVVMRKRSVQHQLSRLIDVRPLDRAIAT